MPDSKKSEKFKMERIAVYDKLMGILNYAENQFFILNEIDNNIDLQNQILGLVVDIRKFYSASGCKGCSENRVSKRPYMSIIRYILKQNNKTLYSTEISIPVCEKKYKKTKKYKIF